MGVIGLGFGGPQWRFPARGGEALQSHGRERKRMDRERESSAAREPKKEEL